MKLLQAIVVCLFFTAGTARAQMPNFGGILDNDPDLNHF